MISPPYFLHQECCIWIQEKGFFLPKISHSNLSGPQRLNNNFHFFFLFCFVCVILQIGNSIKKLNCQQTKFQQLKTLLSLNYYVNGWFEKIWEHSQRPPFDVWAIYIVFDILKSFIPRVLLLLLHFARLLQILQVLLVQIFKIVYFTIGILMFVSVSFSLYLSSVSIVFCLYFYIYSKTKHCMHWWWMVWVCVLYLHEKENPN